MAKKKAAAVDTASAGAPEQSQTIKVERGPWEIDPTTVTDAVDQGSGQWMLFTTAGSYRLTEEEIKPFLPFVKA